MAKKQQIDGGRLCDLAWQFYEKQQKMKALQKRFNEAKAEFEAEMESLLDDLGTKSVRFSGEQLAEGAPNVLHVSMVQRASIEWNADRLEKKVTKPIRRQIIKKHYVIHNMVGLGRYLKACGVDPNEFKRYVTVEKSVDQAEIDRLSQLGKISVKDISGCYVVKCQKPYFTLNVKKDDGDAE